MVLPSTVKISARAIKRDIDVILTPTRVTVIWNKFPVSDQRRTSLWVAGYVY